MTSERTFTAAELQALVAIWRERAAKARKKSNEARFDESSLFQAGKCIALSDCADHLEWYVTAGGQDQQP